MKTFYVELSESPRGRNANNLNRFRSVFIAMIVALVFPAILFAQAPVPAYSGPQNYVINNAITPLYPSNSGGAVAAPGYSSSKSTIFSGNSYVFFARDASGNLYAFDYSNTSNKKLVKLSSTGSLLTTYLTFMSSPEDIEVDAAGNIFALDGSTLYKITPGGTVSTLNSSLYNANGLALDAADNVYVAEYNTSLSSVIEVPADGSSTINIGSGLSYMTDVAVDAAGNVYVCNDGDASIKKIPAGGGSAVTIASGFTSFNTSDLTNIIVDGVGDIFFTERNGSKVSEIPAGTTTPVQISSGYFAPAGLALDLAGNLYIGDNGSLYKVAPVGGYYISPALPSGLSFDSTTGVISGKPTVLSAATNYTITASNSSGSTSAVVSIAVLVSSPTDANLSSLTVGTGTLTPSFSPTTYSYTVEIPNSSIYEALTPTTDNNLQKLSTPGGALSSGFTTTAGPLAVGLNTVYFNVLAQDGVTKNVYSVGITRDASTSTTINSIAATSTYSNASSIQFTATFAASITGLSASNFSLSATGAVSGASVASVTGSGTTYTITVNTGTGDGTIGLNLSNATGLTSGISTSLPFTGGTTTIDKTPPLANTLVYKSNNTNQLVAVQGNSVTLSFTTSETIQTPTVTIGGHAVTATNTSANNWTASYTVTSADPDGRIHFSTILTDLAGNATPYDDIAAGDDVEVKGTDASLSNITLTTGFVKHPDFASTVFNYASFVGAAISTDMFTPTSTDPNATITVNGSTVASGSPSQPISLNFGKNLITIVVTAQDGSTRLTYTDTLYRALATNSNLLTLKTNHGVLTPGFSNTTLSYTKAVAFGVSSITFTGTTVDANASITVGGSATASGTASVPQPLNIGDNIIDVLVTAQDGSSKTFEVTVTRAKSSNDKLFKIVSNRGGLTQTSPGAPTYTKNVNYPFTTINFTVSSVDPNATITVGGSPTPSGTASADQPLSVGDNVIDVIITAQDGVTSQTYTVTVTRAAQSLNTVYESVGVSNPANSLEFAGNDIKVHEGLSPNGDGVNDFLMIEGINNHPDNKLQIMNRSGQLVFEAKGYDNSSKVFDGHSNKNGQMQLPGTYFYSLDYTDKGETKHKTGFLVLKY